ncbi:MAG: crossover junction endodeoxyribonuclease RuvC [Actinobacteria bacterium]|nr:crossover junction endodeoxyribonuclease RuvC [Actinomycetota bacterium]
MKNDYVRVIGIDPGLEITGIAILDVSANQYRPVFCDCIITKKNLPTHARLKQIYESLSGFINKYCPDCLAIEDIFFSSNVKTALSIGAARGVSILAGSNSNLEIFEYTPLQVKQAIVGYGRATKKQIKYMLKMILGIREEFFPAHDDAWDAMGIALCHASMSKFENRIRSYIKPGTI